MGFWVPPQTNSVYRCGIRYDAFTLIRHQTPHYMNKFVLVEDTCLSIGKDFDTEKSNLLEQGHNLVSEWCHPAVGRMATFVQAPIDPATIADSELLTMER